MTDRPMTETLKRAQTIVDHYLSTGFAYDKDALYFCQALLSTSAAVRGMREALKKIKRMPGPWISGPTGTARFLAYSAVVEVIDAVLSGIETEQAQARLDGLAPISTDTKGTTNAR